MSNTANAPLNESARGRTASIDVEMPGLDQNHRQSHLTSVASVDHAADHSNHVLFVHQSADLYGSDRVLLMLVIALKAEGDFNPIVLLPCTGPLVAKLKAAGIEVHVGSVAKISRAMFTPFGFLRTLKALRDGLRTIDHIVAERKISLVHSNTLAVLAGATWAWRRRVVHVWHVHEILLSPRLVSWGLPRLVHCLSAGVIANSSQTKAWLLRMASGLAPKCQLIFNGLPPAPPSAPGAVQSFRDKLGVKNTDVVVSLVGRINRMKGQGVLIEAIAILKARGVLGGTRIAIVGSAAPGCDHILLDLHNKTEALGLASAITFLDFDADIWPIWYGSDIAVMPSTEPESFGMVAIEAMAACLPVIASNHGGVLDIIEDGKTGLLVSINDAGALADALERLIGDAVLRKNMGRQGRQRQFQLFSIDTQAQQTADLYRDLLDSPLRSGSVDSGSRSITRHST
ncbi:MAG: glycosyltransferase family 4 protein [Rhizobacter sp.]